MRGELGERGKAIWDAYGADKLPAGAQALIHELARVADTLDRLAVLAAGDVDTWATLQFEDGGEVSLEINNVIAERRQQQLAFARLLGEIRQSGIKQTKPKDETANDDNDDPGAIILKLQRRSEAG